MFMAKTIFPFNNTNIKNSLRRWRLRRKTGRIPFESQQISSSCPFDQGQCYSAVWNNFESNHRCGMYHDNLILSRNRTVSGILWLK